MRNKLVSVVGVNPPADIASGRIAEVRRRSMSCNCMTRTSQQECRGILVTVTVKVLNSYTTFKYDLRLRRGKRHEEKNDIRIADSRALGRNAGRKRTGNRVTLQHILNVLPFLDRNCSTFLQLLVKMYFHSLWR